MRWAMSERGSSTTSGGTSGSRARELRVGRRRVLAHCCYEDSRRCHSYVNTQVRSPAWHVLHRSCRRHTPCTNTRTRELRKVFNVDARQQDTGDVLPPQEAWI